MAHDWPSTSLFDPLDVTRRPVQGTHKEEAMDEDPTAQAERHVWQGEARVADQEERVKRMQERGYTERAIKTGQILLATLEQTLELARTHLRFERRKGHAR